MLMADGMSSWEWRPAPRLVPVRETFDMDAVKPYNLACGTSRRRRLWKEDPRGWRTEDETSKEEDRQ